MPGKFLETNYLKEAEFYLNECNWDFDLALCDYKVDLSVEILMHQQAKLQYSQNLSKFKKLLKKLSKKKN